MKQQATILAAFTGASLSKTRLCIFVTKILSFSMVAQGSHRYHSSAAIWGQGEAPGFLLGMQDQAPDNIRDDNQLKVPCSTASADHCTNTLQSFLLCSEANLSLSLLPHPLLINPDTRTT